MAAKKSRKSEAVGTTAAAVAAAPARRLASREPGPSVSELSRQAQAANRDGDRALEVSLLRSALNAGASGAERWDLLNRLCDAELTLGRREAGRAACAAVLDEAPDSSAAARTARRLLGREDATPGTPAKAAQPAR
ncbi:hypothetical protein HPC49_52845 [Pyxidicoccus fallax]|nr:hypothetical protein [Pyxidicoccus fallax]